MDPNEKSPVITFPELYDELVGIFTDFKVLIIAMHHEGEGELNVVEMAFTGERITDRLETAVENVATMMAADFP